MRALEQMDEKIRRWKKELKTHECMKFGCMYKKASDTIMSRNKRKF